MQVRLRFLLSGCLGLVLASPALAQEKPPLSFQYNTTMQVKECGSCTAKSDPATLVPAHTLAYLELHQPDRLAEEVRELIKGSLLQDPGRILARARRSEMDTSVQAMLGTLFSPEILAELGDCQDGIVALTGLLDDETPQLVGILRTGKSRMVPLALRFFLASADGIQTVGRVEGVPIYSVGETRTRATCSYGSLLGRAQGAMSGWAPARSAVAYYYTPADSRAGLFLAQLPEAIVAGSTRSAVADAIRRLKGKGKSPSLADRKAFQEATVQRAYPGLFAYADAPRLYRLLKTQMRKQSAEDRDAARRWKLVQAALNPAAVRFVAGSLLLRKGECHCCLEVRTQEGQSIPALDWLADQKLSDDLLRTVPRDAFFVLAMPISEKLRRLDFCERIDKLHTRFFVGFGLAGSSVSKQVQPSDNSEASEMTGPSSSAPLSAREIEKRMEMHVGKDVLARIRALAVAGGLRPTADRKDSECIPVVLIEAASEEDARELEKLWPRLHSLGGNVTQPRTMKVRGETVLCLKSKEGKDEKDDRAFSPMPPYYGRCGKVLVLGWQAGRVAASLAAPSQQRPLLSLPRAQATAQQHAGGLLLLFSGRQLLRQVCSVYGDGDDSGHLVTRQLRHMSQAMKKVPPTVFLVQREGNRYRCEMCQAEMKTAAAPVLNAFVRLLSVTGSSMRVQPSSRYVPAGVPAVSAPQATPLAVPPPIVPSTAPASPASSTAPSKDSAKAQPSEEAEPPVGTPGAEECRHWWELQNRD